MHRSITLSLGALGLLLLAGCSEPAPTAVDAVPERVPTETASPPAAAAGTLFITDPGGSVAWTLRLDGNHVEVTTPDGTRLVGERRGDKRRYRRESDGAAVAEIKFSDAGFKLRQPDGSLLWKVKFGDDKIKISDNEENRAPWQIRTGYPDKAKVEGPDDRELGSVRYGDARTKVKDADGNERFRIDGERHSAAFGVLLLTPLADEHRAILMIELLAADR